MAIRMRRTSLRKPSFREQVEQSNASDRYYAAMFGKDPQAQTVLAPKREYVKRTAEDDSEAAVIIEVAEILRADWRIILAVRQNSGAAGHVSFWKWLKRPRDEKGKYVPMTIPDFWGIATFGFWTLECKRRDWHYTGKDSEPEQKSFIDAVIAAGHRGGFVTSAEQALAILK